MICIHFIFIYSSLHCSHGMFSGVVSEYVVNGVPVDIGVDKVSYAGVRLAALCSHRPCQHYGHCVPAHRPRGYRCLCKANFEGMNCEKPSSECKSG